MGKITGRVREWIWKIESFFVNRINSIKVKIDRKGKNRRQRFSFNDFCLLLAYYGLLPIGFVCKWIEKITGFVCDWIRKIKRHIKDKIKNWERENRFQQSRV